MTETGEGHDTDNQGSVCKVGTQDPENLDEELKPLVTVWSLRALRYTGRSSLLAHSSYARLTLRLSSFHSSTSRSDRAPEE